MNCDFLENEFFYYQLSRQGEKQATNDSLSWLPLPISSPGSPKKPTDKVSGTTEHVSDTPRVFEDLGAASQQESTSSNILEVRSSDYGSLAIEANHDNREAAQVAVIEEPIEVDMDTGQYTLPLRSTRGIPPKR